MDEAIILFIINALFGLLSIIFGWIMKTLWNAVSDLQQADTKLAEKVSSIEVLVAGQYVKRDEFQGAINRLFEKLDAIEAKIDHKADKQ